MFIVGANVDPRLCQITNFMSYRNNYQLCLTIQFLLDIHTLYCKTITTKDKEHCDIVMKRKLESGKQIY